MKLPTTFSALGAPITIREGECPPGALGFWDERDGSIVITPGQSEFGRLTILVHEAMHVVETMMIQNGALKRRVSHDYITGAAFALATILVHAGAAGDVTPKGWGDFCRSQEGTKRSRRKMRAGAK